jgi:hypothetical protein
VGGDVPVDSETLLVTDFINLKIKPTQSFGGAYRGRVCVRVFIGVIAHMNICVCTMFLRRKKNTSKQSSPCTLLIISAGFLLFHAQRLST